MIILKVTKNQGFILSLEDTFFEKPQWSQIDPLPPAVLELKISQYSQESCRPPTLLKTYSNTGAFL